jgi:hypothetical protein
VDPTLRAILAELYQAHVTIDQLRARVQQLEQQDEQKTRAEETQELAALWTGPPPKD